MKTDLLKNNCKVLFSMLICSGFIMSPMDMMAKDSFSTMRIQQENVTVAGTVKDVNGEPIIGLMCWSQVLLWEQLRILMENFH